MYPTNEELFSQVAIKLTKKEEKKEEKNC